MLVSALYDVNTVCAQDIDNVIYTKHFIIPQNFRLNLYSVLIFLIFLYFVFSAAQHDFISEFCYIYLGFYLQVDKPLQ